MIKTGIFKKKYVHKVECFISYEFKELSDIRQSDTNYLQMNTKRHTYDTSRVLKY